MEGNIQWILCLCCEYRASCLNQGFHAESIDMNVLYEQPSAKTKNLRDYADRAYILEMHIRDILLSVGKIRKFSNFLADSIMCKRGYSTCQRPIYF